MLVATISLAFQVAILLLLFVGYNLKRMARFRQHGVTMLVGVVLHLIMILGLMVPSFVIGVIPLISRNAASAVAMLVPFHIATGASAAVLGVWIVASWRMRPSTVYCAPKKKLMLATLILWTTALVIGIMVYLSLYTMLFP
jgi:hypothetical protein